MNTPAPLGLRDFNPWNLQQAHVPWIGLVQQEPETGELIFDDLIDGIRAGIRLCYTYQRMGLNTPAKFIQKFSPAAAGNPTAQYCTNACDWTGFAADQPIDFHIPAVMIAWAKAIFRQEQGPDYGITDDEITQAIAAAQ
jgi:hypothetical protein